MEKDIVGAVPCSRTLTLPRGQGNLLGKVLEMGRLGGLGEEAWCWGAGHAERAWRQQEGGQRSQGPTWWRRGGESGEAACRPACMWPPPGGSEGGAQGWAVLLSPEEHSSP